MSRLTCQLSCGSPQNSGVNYVVTSDTVGDAFVMSRVIVDTMSCDIVDKPASWFLFSKAPVVVFRSVGCAVLEGLFLWLNGTRKQHPADLATARKKVHGL